MQSNRYHHSLCEDQSCRWRLVMGNGLSDNGSAALDGGRYSIHDVTIDDIDPVKYEGYGVFAQVSTGRGAPILHDVTLNHITAFQPGVMLNIAIGSP